MTSGMQSELEAVLAAQDGVISRRQVLDGGGTDTDIERKVQRREWARIHDGVYVDHTVRRTGGSSPGRRFSSTGRLPWAVGPRWWGTGCVRPTRRKEPTSRSSWRMVAGSSTRRECEP
jgi:hypothetical protein